MLRSPVVCILAHVDHGKTSILDRIRGTAVASKEAGGITQMIGAYYLPTSSILAFCGPALAKSGQTLKIPGLLFIDTPGHEAFTSMRERGGSIADIAILVIDIMQGIQPQTLESIQILRQHKTPFIIALNKIDMLEGWKSQDTSYFLESFHAQTETVQARLEEKLYTTLGRLSEMGFESERFDRITDYTKQLVMVPCSAKTGEGIADLLLYLSGISQRFLENSLRSNVDGPARGSILELKDEKGLGTTIDVIIYDGTLRKNITVVFATQNGVGTAKVRAILRAPLPGEVVPAGERFVYIDEVHAAAGVKLFAPGLSDALPGSPIMVAENQADILAFSSEISLQVKGILFSREASGVVVRTDTLGSAEALLRLLEAEKIPIKSVGIGPVAKKDIIDSHAVSAQDKYLGAVLAFNVGVSPEMTEAAASARVPIFSSRIIYNVIEKYRDWVAAERKKDSEATLCVVVLPAKLRVLPNCFFRLSKPAVFGVEVIGGKLRSKALLVDSHGNEIGQVKQMQADGKPVEMAGAGTQLAISVDGAYCGKSFNAGDVLFTYIDRKTAETIRSSCKGELSSDDIVLLDQIVEMTSGSLI